MSILVWSVDIGLVGLALIAGTVLYLRLASRRNTVERVLGPVPDPEPILHKLMNQAPIGYFELDGAGRFTFVNDREAELRGIVPEEIVHKYLWELEPLSLQPRIREETMRKLAGERVLMPYERRYQRPDGVVLTLETHEVLLHDSRGLFGASGRRRST